MSDKSKKNPLVCAAYLLAAFLLPPALLVLAIMASREWYPHSLDPATTDLVSTLSAILFGCLFIRSAIADEGWRVTLAACVVYLLLMLPLMFIVGLAFVGGRYGLFL